MSQKNESNRRSGVGMLLKIVALILSIALNHSFWWGLLHWILGWVYVVYVIIFRTKEIVPAVKALFM